MPTAENTITISSEQDAIDLLNSKTISDNDGTAEANPTIKFDGWPQIHIKLTGDRFDQSLTTDVMRDILAMQSTVNKLYASITHRRPQNLTAEERDSLQITVKVTEGSTNIDIDVAETLKTLLTDTNMNAQHIIALAVLCLGGVALMQYLKYRAEIKLSDNQVKIKELERESINELNQTVRKALDETNEVTKLSVEALAKTRYTKIAEEAADEFSTSASNILTHGDSATFNGSSFDPKVIELVRTQKRLKSERHQLRMNAKILATDLQNPKISRVTLLIADGVHSKQRVSAEIKDATIGQTVITVIQTAEWARSLIDITLDARVKNNEIVKATIIDAKATSETQNAP